MVSTSKTTPAPHGLRGKLTDNLDRIGLDRPADRYELQHVEARRSPFLVLDDEALRLLEPPGDLSLREPGRLPGPLRRARKRSWAAVWIGLRMRPGSGEALRKLIR